MQRTIPGTGSYQLVSNPYCVAGSDPTMGWTLTASDTMGRVTSVGHYAGQSLPASWPGGSNSNSTGVATTSYGASGTGSVSTVTDEAGVTRTMTSDGLGRLTQLTDGSGTTSYGYSLNNLTAVTQSSQSRSFSYTSLGRLLTATNPESGTVQYAYDADGNLATRTDARGIALSFTYNPLNQPLTKEYSDYGSPNPTPWVSYTYGGCQQYSVGRLCSVSEGGESSSTYPPTGYPYGATTYTYDSVGRFATSTQYTGSNSYPFSYAYNLNDGLTSETYPSGRVVAYGYNGAGRVNSVTGHAPNSGPTTQYASGIGYAPQHALSSMNLANGVAEAWGYNSRLQPTGIQSQLQSNNLLTLSYGYATTTNNGNVASATMTILPSGGPTISQGFTYDSLNRLSYAAENSCGTNQWCQTYGYDVYGNRTASSTVQGISSLTPTSFNTSNKVTAPYTWTYDLAGNLTQEASQLSYAYDAESRQIAFCATGTGCTPSSATELYFYDGDGKRIQTQGGGVTTTFVYDANGHVAAEYATSATEVLCSETCYLMTDSLGSTRMATDQAGNVQLRQDYLPFGQTITVSSGNPRSGIPGYGAAQTIRPQFTSKERDSESGNDWFLARYYSGAQGRFTSIDPEGVGSTRGDPQSWNMYAYVGNNPLRYADPFGLNYDVCNSRGENCATLTDEQYQQYLASIQNSGVYVTPSGQINYQNSDGSVTNIGSAGYYNERAENAAAFLNWTLTQMSLNAVFQGASRAAGALVGRAFEAVTSGRVAGAAAEDAIASSPVGRRGAPIDIAPGTNAGTKIGDRWYTGHALDQMQGRGAVPSVVEDTISTGTKSPGNLPNTIKYSTSQADVVTNTRGDVVTVIVKSGK